MRMTAFGLATLAVLVGAVPAAHAAGEPAAYRMTTSYRVYWLGLPVFSGSVTGRRLDGRYALAFSSRSIGVLRVMHRSRVEAKAAGIIGPARYRPLRYRLRAKWKRKQRSVDMDFTADGGFSLSVTPPEKRKREPVPPDVAAAAFDPLTALLHSTTVPLDAKACSLAVPVFDGKRRFDVLFEPAGKETLTTLISPLLDREAVKCKVRVRRIAGFTDKEIRDMDKSKDKQPVIWVSKLRSLKMWMPVHITYMSKWGPTVVRVEGIDVAPLAETGQAPVRKTGWTPPASTR